VTEDRRFEEILIQRKWFAKPFQGYPNLSNPFQGFSQKKKIVYFYEPNPNQPIG
jgi:hypothetical protein